MFSQQKNGLNFIATFVIKVEKIGFFDKLKISPILEIVQKNLKIVLTSKACILFILYILFITRIEHQIFISKQRTLTKQRIILLSGKNRKIKSKPIQRFILTMKRKRKKNSLPE